MATREGRPLTAAETKAFRMGFIAGIERGAEVLATLRLTVAAASVYVPVPTHWPAQAANKKRGGRHAA